MGLVAVESVVVVVAESVLVVGKSEAVVVAAEFVVVVESAAVVVAAEFVLVVVESAAVVMAAEFVVVVESAAVVVAQSVLVVESVAVVLSVIRVQEPVLAPRVVAVQSVVVVWAEMADQCEVLLTLAVEEEVGGWEAVVRVVVLALVSPAGQRWRASIVGQSAVGWMTVGRSVTRARAIQWPVYRASLLVAMFSIVILAGRPQPVSRRQAEARPGPDSICSD